MKAALVVTWTGTKTGREAQAIAYGREVDEFWGKFAAQGKCSEPRWYWSMKGTNLWIVEGEYEDLLMISGSPEGQKLSLKGQFLADGFQEELCLTGREEMMQHFESLMAEMQIV